MGILDSFRRSKEEKKEKTTPPPQGHTLAEVLQDKNKSHLFGKLLEQGGNKDLAQRLAEGKLDESDINLLEVERLAFSEKMARAEKVEKLLTKENVIDFARNNPEFEKILNLVGPEKAVKAIQSQLRDISIADEGRFSNIVGAMETFESYKDGEYKEVNDRVEKLLKDNKITSQEYLATLAIEDPVEKEKALKKLVTKSYGKYDKICDFLSGGGLSRDTIKDLQDSETSLESKIAELNTYQNDIGAVLFSSVSGNDNMRNALFSELVNEKSPEEPKFSFKEVKNGTLDETKWDEDWEERKESTRFSTETPRVQELIRNNFRKDQKKANKEKNEGTGFWHDIVIAITEALMKKKELK